MERDKTDGAKDIGPDETEANIVESGGETTAAATGPAEIGAAKGEPSGEDQGNARPVGADTMVKVADEPDSTRS